MLKNFNKTAQFLRYDLERFGEIFMHNLYAFNMESINIGDNLYDRIFPEHKEKGLHIIYDLEYMPKEKESLGMATRNQRTLFKDFMLFLKFIRKHDAFLNDYVYEDNKHCIVIRTSENLISKFIKGKYSEMYDQKFVEKYCLKSISISKAKEEELKQELGNIYNNIVINDKFENKTITKNPAYCILTKDKDYEEIFTNKVNETFFVDLTPKDLFIDDKGKRKDIELDIPPDLEKEMLR